MGAPLHIVALGEARELLSVLRRNRRFGYFLSFTTASQPSEHPFVKEIKLLRDIILDNNKDINAPLPNGILEPLISEQALRRVLEPFLHVITSRDASGVITGVALLCVDRIMACLFHLVSAKNDRNLWSEYAPSLNIVVDAIAACRFDVTDPATDEVVLSRITTTIARICTSSAVPFLSDASFLRGVEACLGVACGRRRASELLRRSAESALCEVIAALGKFTKRVTEGKQPSLNTIVKTLALDGANSGGGGTGFGHSFNTEGFDESGPLSATTITAIILVLCRMVEPSSSSPAESVIGLQILSSLLTFGGSNLMQIAPVRESLLRNCSFVVLRCVGSFKSPLPVIAASFTTARLLVHVLGNDGTPFLSTLLGDVYPCYISGFENVKATSIPDNSGNVIQGNATNGHAPGGATNGISSAANMSGEIPSAATAEIDPVVREVGLESMADLLSAPGLLSSLYAEVDCDRKSDDVIGPLLFALGQASVSSTPRKRSKRLRASSSGSTRMSSGISTVDSDEEDNGIITGGNSDSIRFRRSAALLCAEAVLAVVHTIGERMNLLSDGTIETSPNDAELMLNEKRRVKSEKLRSQKVAQAFSSQPKINKAERLISFLRDVNKGTYPSFVHNVKDELDMDVAACVQFLRETRGLSKEMIGVILGEPGVLSQRVLSSFTSTFNFRNRKFTDCIRLYLESFRLPGEAQKIDRIVECFSKSFYAQNRSAVESSEQNHAVNSTLGLFRTSDAVYTLTFSVVLLNTDLHNDQVRRKMSLEEFIRNNRGGNDSENFPQWFLEEIYESISSVEIRLKDEAGMEAMTSAHWDEILEDMLTRNRKLIDNSDARSFDEDIFALCWQSAVAAANTTLTEAGDANQAQKALEGFVSVARCATAFRQNRPVDVVVASLVNATNLLDGTLYGAVFRFGTDIKAQMSAVVLSDISRQCGDCLRTNGWQALISYVLRLHALCLLPDDLENLLGSNGTDLDVLGDPLPDSNLVPTWWPSQGHRRVDRDGSDDDKPKKTMRAKGFIAALFAASIGSDASSEEEYEYTDGRESEFVSMKKIRVSNNPPSYLKIRGNEQIEAQKLARKCISRCRVEDFLIDEAKILRSDALHCLTRAIARAAGRILDASGFYPNSAGDDNLMDKGQDNLESLSTANDGIIGSVPADPLMMNYLVNLKDFAPSSPPADSSAIVGVAASVRSDSYSVELDGDFRGYSTNGAWSGQLRNRDERKAREFVVAFCIDLLCNFTLQNRDRLHIPWPALHAVLIRIIAPATRPSALLERAIISLLRVATRLLHRDELRNDVLRTLNLIVRLPNEATSALSTPIASGLYNLVKSHGAQIASSTSGWHAIFSIIESMPRCSPTAVDTALKLLSFVLAENSLLNAVRPETFAPLLEAVMAFVTKASLNASLQALDLLTLLSRKIPFLTGSDKINCVPRSVGDTENGQQGVFWAEFWGPILKGFSTGARDPRGKVRNEALVALEKVIAVCGSAELLTAKQWKVALSTVIFPLMKQLFSTQGFLDATIEAERAAQEKLRIVSSGSATGKTRRSMSADHDEQLIKSVLAACDKTRMRALMLTSKTFLQHHSVIAAGLSAEEFTDLWLGVLDVFRISLQGNSEENRDTRINYGRGPESDELREHVPESVKNMLLVMSDCGLLSESDPMRWNATFDLIRTFLPEKVADIESLFATMSFTDDSRNISVPAST